MFLLFQRENGDYPEHDSEDDSEDELQEESHYYEMRYVVCPGQEEMQVCADPGVSVYGIFHCISVHIITFVIFVIC
jgi:hypothetical protein